ncbi:MAG: CBS domain-containing protein [Candidatus Odinarchaeia archaeon]
MSDNNVCERLKLIEEDKVKEHMYADPVTAKPDTPMETILKLFVSTPFSTVIIVEGKKPIGIITESSVLEFFKPIYRLTHERVCYYLLIETAEEYMTKNPIMINESDIVRNAVTLMENFEIKQLIVIDDEKNLAGLLTLKKLVADALGVSI